MIIPRFLIALLLLLSCSSGIVLPESSSPYNDAARYLSGLPVNTPGRLKSRTNARYYRDHVDIMDNFWESYTDKNLKFIEQFREEYLKNVQPGTVLYPLSGADFINAFLFFPDAREYIMVALEEPGELPDLETMEDTAIENILFSLHRTIWTTASLNYFKSRGMREEMSRGPLTGTLPVILIYAARLGLDIKNIEKIRINPMGEIIETGPSNKNGNGEKVTGNRITFTVKNDPTPRTLLYLKLRLGSRSSDPRSPSGKFLRGISGEAMIMKSAIYLLHNAKYKNLCDFLLSSSDIIIQDDSAIPYNYYDKNMWDIRLFGVYTGPKKIQDLDEQKPQNALIDDYRKKSVPVRFRFGYGAWDNRTNLQLFLKKNDQSKDTLSL